NMITCYGNIQHLACDIGLIKVKSTIYGRTNCDTCSNRPPSEVANTNCALSISTIADRCNGLRECEVKTVLLGNPDPCYGTYKYYNTTYDCISGRTLVTCEGNTAILTCGVRHINIISANYGRTDSTTCSSGRPASQLTVTNCYTPDALNKVAARCEGQSSCNVPATNEFFSDPCVGTYKYLTVVYSCF
ncbi:hypothetical protein Q7C36_012385, partial [Tachysurus vachellii]